jgi:hypothetical protein
VLSACGRDDEPGADTAPALPDLSVPGSDTPETATAEPVEPEVEPDGEPEPAPAPAETVPSSNGGTPAPEAEPPADTPENDTPPPPDSPAERFEQFCDDNPGACD